MKTFVSFHGMRLLEIFNCLICRCFDEKTVPNLNVRKITFGDFLIHLRFFWPAEKGVDGLCEYNVKLLFEGRFYRVEFVMIWFVT